MYSINFIIMKKITLITFKVFYGYWYDMQLQ